MAGTWTWIGSTDDPTAPGNWTLTAGSGGSIPQSGDTATFPGGTTVPPLFTNTAFTDVDLNLINNATVDLGNTSSDPTNSGINGTSTIDAAGTATTLSIAGPFSSAGLIEVTGTLDSLAIQLAAGSAAAGMLVNSGQIVVDQGDTLAITGGTLQSPAGIAVNGSALVGSTLSGLNNFAIGNGGSLELTQAGSNALTEITFGGTSGGLKLDAPTAFVGGISGFVLGDTLDLGVFNAATVIFDGAGDITVIGSNGVFTASDSSSGPLDGFDNQGTFTLTATGGLAGNLNVVEGSGGDTVLTVLPPSAWQWENVTSTWSLVSGPGNGWLQPQAGDTAIITAGTVSGGNHLNLVGNTIELGGTGGTIAAFIAAGDTSTTTSNPTLDGNSVIDSAVPHASAPETSLLIANGIFINEGLIDAVGPAGSSFTIEISGTTPSGGTFQPGYFINYNQIEVNAGNSMTITVAGTSELLNASVIQVNGGTLDISVSGSAIAGGYAPGTGVIVIDGGGTVETNVSYAPTISGIPPVYAFADATAGNTLKIDNIDSFGGVIFGFGQNDTIDFGGSVAIGTVVYNGTSGILELENPGGTIVGSVQLASGDFLSAGTQVGTFAVSGTVAGPFNVLTGADGDIILTTGVANDYTTNTSGAWQSTGVWAGGSLPGTLDTVLLGDGAKTPFTLTTGGSPVTVGALALTSDPTLLQITSNTTVSPYPIRLFGGTLEVTGARTLTASAISQSGGTLQLDSGGVLDLTGYPVDGVSPLYNIVPANNGTISVSNSGTAALELGSGTVLITGGTLNAGTSQAGGDGGAIHIGYEGSGTPASLTVQNSGTHAGVVTDTYALVGSDPTSFGVLTLDGNVTWTDQIDPHDTVETRGYMIVGYNGQDNNTGLTPPFSGTATLAVENGATLNEQSYAVIGDNFDSAGSVLVSDGLWNIGTTNGGYLVVGLGGEGTLLVTNNGTVAVSHGGTFSLNGTTFANSGISLGSSVGGSGSLTVSGAGALVTDKAGMSVGGGGTGDLQIVNGGSILLTGTNGINVGTSFGASGTILVSGTDFSSGAPALLSMASTTKGITVGADGQGLLDVESGGSIALNGTGGIAIGQSIDGTGLVIVNGPDAFITLGTASAGIGIAQAGTTSGTLLVENGGTILLNGTGGISDGVFAGSNGLIDINGPNSLIDEGTAGTGMSVGTSGNGTLVIENGGTLALQATGLNDGVGVGQSAGATGLIVVSGTSSLFSMNTPNAGLSLGGSGTGTLTVESGGAVRLTGNGLNIGTGPGGSGTATVTGTGSSIVLAGSNAAVSVGATGNGVLNINSGGSVSASSVYIAQNAGTATGVVTVNGGTLTDGGALIIGNTGTGTLQVLGHGLVQVTGFNGVNVGGFGAGSNGFLLINSGGTLSETNAGGDSFSIGGTNVAGFAVVEGGGTLITGSTFGFADINATGTGAASALVTGGTWVSNGSIIVGDTGRGALEIASGGVVNASTQSIIVGNQNGGAGTLTVLAGGLLLANSLSLDNFFNSTATGSLDVAGGTVSVGSLSLGANSVATVSSGSLAVSGNATIGNNGTGAMLGVTGGDVTVGSVNIGLNPGSSGTVTVSGGTLETTGLLNIGNSGSGLVTVDAGGTLIATDGLQFDLLFGTSGTLVVNGGSVAVSNGLSVGNGGTAAVIVEAGGTLTATGTNTFNIGNLSGGTGQVTVNDGVFSVSGAPLDVGSGGNGTLLVENGGTATATFSGGGPGVDINSGNGFFGGGASVTVTGAGSALNAGAAGTQFVVGDNGSGSLTISAGGVVNAGTNSVDVGNVTGGNGTVALSGAGSFAMNGLYVGNNGVGTLSMSGGTITDSNSLFVGFGSGASGNATLNGGAILTADGVTVGNSGVGTLTLNGGTITDSGTYTFAGSSTGGVGTIAINGSGAVLNSNAFIISNFGVGVGSVDSGGVVNAVSLSVGQFFDGSLTIAGGTITTSGTAAGDAVGNASGSDGTLSVSGGGVLTDAASLTFGINSGATGAGTVGSGTVTVGGNVVIGNSGFGTLTVNSGGTILANGTFDGVGLNNGGFGELAINSGGKFVFAATLMAVGGNAGSSGEVIINAGGTLQFTEASQSGTQALRIGAVGASGSLAAAQGNVLVTGIGALLSTNNNPIAVGNGGTGNLTVSQGGSVVVGTPDNNAFYALGIANPGGAGAVTVTDAGSTLTSNGYLLDGRGGAGSLTIKNDGVVVVNDAAANGSGVGIGAGRGAGPSAPSNVGGDGVALVTSGGVLDVNSTTSGVTVGGDGVNGALTVNNGGTVLTGAGLTVGTATEASGTIYGGAGELTIGTGGTVLVNNPIPANGYDIVVGNAGSSIGTATTGTATGSAIGEATVSGIGALLNANGFGIAVGWLSSGDLTVSLGGTILSGTTNDASFNALSIGRRAAGSVTITDPGSVIRTTGGVYAGRAGSGSLTIENYGSLIAGLDGVGQTGIAIGGVGFGNGVSTSNGVTYLMTGGSGTGLVTSNGYMFSQQWLDVGTEGVDGLLTVNQGGTAEAATQIVVGDSTTVPGGDSIITPTGSYVASTSTLIATAGMLAIGPGGLVKSDGPHVFGTPSVIVGAGAGASGTVNVTGGGSAGVDPGILSTGGDPLMVGQFGEGSVLVNQAGTILAGTTFAHDEAITLGGSVGSTGGLTVTDAGSLVRATGQVDVGGAGAGSLLVENSATVVTGNNAVDANEGFDVGASAGSNGSATVSNHGTLVNAGTFVVGDGGVGSLNIQSGGMVITSPGTTGAAAVIADQASSGGSSVQVTGAGSSFQIAGTLLVGNYGAASLNISAGGTVTASSLDAGVQNNGTAEGTAQISLTGAGSDLAISGDATLADAGSASMSILNGATFAAANLTIGSQGSASGALLVSDTGSVLDIAGTLNVGTPLGVGELTIGPNGTVIASKVVLNGEVVNEGGLLDPNEIDITANPIVGYGTEGGVGDIIVNDLSIEAKAGSKASQKVETVIGTVVGTYGTLSGTGYLVIDAGSTLDLQGGPVDSSQTVTFGANTGALVVEDIGGFTATIGSFQAGDTIFVHTAGTATFSQSGSAVDVISGGATLGVLDFASAGLAATAIGTGGALMDVPCFAAGTRIRTVRGEVRVEELREGDVAITAIDGSLAPVVWIGHREVDCARHPDPRSVWPVRIRAGAFGRGLPKRALTLSPDHAVYVNDVLVPVKHLVNGTTIAQVKVDRVTYYHVELDRHDVVYADGLPAESYLDVGDRANFANGGAVVRLHIDLAHHWEAGGCAPLVVWGEELEGVKAVVAAMAAELTQARAKHRTGRNRDIRAA